MKNRFRKTAKVTLVLIYLVIVAGAIVRMTGSGMGCPDWPKCFGYFVPPTDISELQFQPNHNYKKGIIIIVNEELQVSTQGFTSEKTLNLNNWKPYTAHDYAVFNPIHTWVEYINRLIGALSGIPILIFSLMSIWLWKNNKLFLLLSIITILAMAFQAWLGKTVVDSNLAPYKITIHMVMAIVIVGIILYLIYASRSKVKHQIFNSKFRNVLFFAILLTLIQIILGTQVRQFVDVQNKLNGYFNWDITSTAPLQFYIHRTISILVLVLNAWLFICNRTLNLGYVKLKLVLVCIGLEITTGIAMYYFNFPFSTQPLHLVIATIMIGIQFYIILESSERTTLKNTIGTT